MRPDPFEAIERRVGGRLGVAGLDLGSGQGLGRRSGERFPMCSTFKALLAARVLAGVDRGAERLDARVAFGPGDLVGYAPVTRARVAQGSMTVAELCQAAVTLSDNGAANLLLARVGGPAGLTRWLRSVGDGTTRLDRTEPALNEARPGDPRDTSTPDATVATWRALLFGPVLTPASRARLTGWLERCETGDRRLRAGLPRGWRVGDKTGTNDSGTSNDIAFAVPPGRAPILIAAYLTAPAATAEAREAALADVGRVVAQTLGGGRG